MKRAQGEMDTISYWFATPAFPAFPAIERDIEMNVVVAGLGSWASPRRIS